MDRETYKELQSLSDEFEESVKRPVGNARQYSENDLFCTEISENDSDHDQNNQNLEYQDRRSRRISHQPLLCVYKVVVYQYENILHKHLMSFSGKFWSFYYTYSAHTISRKSSWKEYLPLLTHNISCLQDYNYNSLQGQELNAMPEGQDAEVIAYMKVFKLRISSDVSDVHQSGFLSL